MVAIATDCIFFNFLFSIRIALDGALTWVHDFTHFGPLFEDNRSKNCENFQIVMQNVAYSVSALKIR